MLDDESKYEQWLVRQDTNGMPARLVRRSGGTFTAQQSLQLPNGQSSKQAIQLTGAKRLRQPRRTTVKEYNLWGGLKREVITEEMLEVDFCESLETMFDNLNYG